ncbi:hypothetical protein L227DRAFT_575359 [Lentinus tigrinus ALCF2SS1-6]|uniref:Uncharacterized protein n=1 Tax=Lentinus tigrinus ALCF2SS1-6 TaxID=1328759 RepID=A0A5C2S985_9APHY|nr:hypothetical protein L227DRAFT_575359 [Lentinus tigrinus ALCF2SS1-6]
MPERIMNVHPRGLRRKPAITNLSRSDVSVSRESTSAESENDQVPELGMPPRRPRPTVPSKPTAVVLAFRQLGFNTMVASSAERDMTGQLRAQYHITVHMNCFCPSSFATVIRREKIDGEFVGSFEMGISTQKAAVNMYGIEKHMDTVLSRDGKRTAERIWRWKWEDVPQHSICWHRESPVRYVCFFPHLFSHGY